jgi:hypothetical protein
MDYKAAYTVLFNGITTAIDEIEGAEIKSQEAVKGIKILKAAQQRTEEMYIEAGKDEDG